MREEVRGLSHRGSDRGTRSVRISLKLIEFLEIECGLILRVGPEVWERYDDECGEDIRE